MLDQIFKGIEDYKAEPAALTLRGWRLPGSRPSATSAWTSMPLSSCSSPVTRSPPPPSLPAAAEAPTLANLMREEEARLGEIIGNLPAAKQRYALHTLPGRSGRRPLERPGALHPAADAQRPRRRGSCPPLRDQRTHGRDAGVPGPLDPRLFHHLRDAALAVQGARQREVRRASSTRACSRRSCPRWSATASARSSVRPSCTTCFPATGS